MNFKHDSERLESARPVRIISAILPDGKDQPDIHAGVFTCVVLPDDEDQTGIHAGLFRKTSETMAFMVTSACPAVRCRDNRY
ncbi:hypothetical protein, partial [Rhodanobacter denitrificans]|uniref:hypothetical protein n=1 Tax=Rhodanobacter denitrificans TaxID=666685 RepID=UPI001CB96FE7